MLRQEFDTIISQDSGSDDADHMIELLEQELSRDSRLKKNAHVRRAFNPDARRRVEKYMARKQFNDEYGYLFDESKY